MAEEIEKERGVDYCGKQRGFFSIADSPGGRVTNGEVRRHGA
jgi:hypothetical protein